jgi:hypothetical protein
MGGGTVVAQTGSASGQRSWKGQPAGRALSSGEAPGMGRPPNSGIARSKARL